MSMLPFFPSLKPSVVNSIWFNVDVPVDDENELRELEKEHHDTIWAITQTAADLYPIGKVLPMAGPETDDEDANDSDDTDSHDNDDEDEDEMDTTIDNNQLET